MITRLSIQVNIPWLLAKCVSFVKKDTRYRSGYSSICLYSREMIVTDKGAAMIVVVEAKSVHD